MKVSQNKAQAVETPDYQVSTNFIDRLMQQAPATRQEHAVGQRALMQIVQALQKTEQLPGLLKKVADLQSQAGIADRQTAKLQKQIDKLKGK